MQITENNIFAGAIITFKDRKLGEIDAYICGGDRDLILEVVKWL